MSNAKYIGLDVHQATTVAAVLDASGKLVMEAIVETKAATILDFIEGIRGELNVTLEEGTCADWLHDLLEPHVHRVVVCDPRKNALLKTTRPVMGCSHMQIKRATWTGQGLAPGLRQVSRRSSAMGTLTKNLGRVAPLLCLARREKSIRARDRSTFE
jgi:hypothetical protein